MDLNELFSNTFLKELTDIEDKDPGQPVDNEKEKGVGTMEPVERKLYALGMGYARTASLLLTGAEFDAKDKEEKESLLLAEMDAKACAIILKDIMWSLIKDRLSLQKMNIGVRENFQIVAWQKDENSNPISELLKGKLGSVKTIAINPKDLH